MSDYDSLLDRAKEELPEPITQQERFQLPDLNIRKEGKTTVVRNFADVLDRLNRDPDEVVPRLLREMGAARLEGYVETYVLCSECGRPDTHLQKEGRTLVLQCDACGGHRPVRARKPTAETEQEADAVEEGEVYELKIEDTGRQGDGVAHKDKYTIFVEGAGKGQVVKAKINNISGTLAFGEMIEVVEG
ncbi:translation initiation factor IF-2 subunit beta [Thermoplasmatales archaeon SW_10_69_26]|nr:MAG: translation initiation factor IF-2 subunit beta [Thermoplasmatales archaeon SW_10_69_26]